MEFSGEGVKVLTASELYPVWIAFKQLDEALDARSPTVKAMKKSCCCLFVLAACPYVFAQQVEQPGKDGLAAVSARLRATTSALRGIDGFQQVRPSQWDEYESRLRDWIESRLPSNLAELAAGFPSLETELNGELAQAHLLEPQPDEPTLGYVASLKLSRPIDFANALAVQTGISVPCGRDTFVLVYQFTGDARVRLLEEHGTSKGANTLVEARFSAPDASGNRLFYASWNPVQCASVWYTLEFRLYRVEPDSDHPALLFSDSQLYTIDGDLNVRLTPDELLLEFEGEGIEGGFRRTHALHYSVGAGGVQRIEPFALQAQDFVHEWLIETWSEMRSLSEKSPPGTMEKWHRFLQAPSSGYEFTFVQPCKERLGVTQVAIAIGEAGAQDILPSQTVYVLVEDKGDHRYRMLEGSFVRQSGCPGETEPTYDHLPSLFGKQ